MRPATEDVKRAAQPFEGSTTASEEWPKRSYEPWPGTWRRGIRRIGCAKRGTAGAVQSAALPAAHNADDGHPKPHCDSAPAMANGTTGGSSRSSAGDDATCHGPHGASPPFQSFHPRHRPGRWYRLSSDWPGPVTDHCLHNSYPQHAMTSVSTHDPRGVGSRHEAAAASRSVLWGDACLEDVRAVRRIPIVDLHEGGYEVIADAGQAFVVAEEESKWPTRRWCLLDVE